jgi:SRSO17 transposase
MGVFLAYARVHSHAWLDRALYLPQVWTDDRARCQHAGGPAEQRLATQPQLARPMLQRAFEARVPATGVPGDRVYGEERRRRVWWAEQDHAYVMAVSGKEYVWRAGRQHQGKSVLAALVTEGGERLSAGDGPKGPRWYDWCWLPLAAPWQPDGRRWLLVRRSLRAPAALTASVVFAPRATPLATVVQVAGSRWAIERSFEEAKGAVGLDHYDVRSWTGWYRHMTLARWAYALLTVLRAVQRPTKEAPKKMWTQPTPSSLATFKATRGLRCD